MVWLENITLSQVWGWIMAVFVAVVSIDKGIDVFRKWQKLSPDAKQKEKIKELDGRVSKLENSAKEYTGFFLADKARLDTIEEGNRVTQEAILALLRHAINDNNIEACEKAETDLHEYLINRKTVK